jgi:hypothetical protein
VGQEALSELSKIANVSSPEKEAFYDGIHRSVHAVWLHYYFIDMQRNDDSMDNRIRSLTKMERSFVQLTKAAKSFLGLIVEFGDSERELPERIRAGRAASEGWAQKRTFGH